MRVFATSCVLYYYVARLGPEAIYWHLFQVNKYTCTLSQVLNYFMHVCKQFTQSTPSTIIIITTLTLRAISPSVFWTPSTWHAYLGITLQTWASLSPSTFISQVLFSPWLEHLAFMAHQSWGLGSWSLVLSLSCRGDIPLEHWAHPLRPVYIPCTWRTDQW